MDVVLVYNLKVKLELYGSFDLDWIRKENPRCDMGSSGRNVDFVLYALVNQ